MAARSFSRDPVRALRAHLASHNRRVLLLGFATLVVATLLWLMLYTVLCWFLLLFLAAIDAGEMQLPNAFLPLFCLVALCLLIVAWVDRRLTPNAIPPDNKSAWEVASDFVLSIPRATLAIWGTFSAYQHLSRAELELACALLMRLARERRIAVRSVPQEIPEPNRRLKILFALQLSQVIDLRNSDGDLWIVLNPLRPRSLRLAPPR